MTVTFGQSEGEDVVLLKNGSEHIGKIIEQKPSQHIRLLQLPSNDTLTIRLEEIDRILKREIQVLPEAEIQAQTAPKHVPETIETEANYHQSNYHFHINGMASGGDYASVGLGVGLYRRIGPVLQLGAVFNYYGSTRNFDTSRGPAGSIPFGLDIEYMIQSTRQNRLGLQLGCQLGYNFVTQGGHQRNDKNAYFNNGLYVHPSIGFRCNIWKEAGLLLELGYQNIQSKSYYSDNNALIQKHSFSNIILGGSIFF